MRVLMRSCLHRGCVKTSTLNKVLSNKIVTYSDRKDLESIFPAHLLTNRSKLGITCRDEGVAGRGFGFEVYDAPKLLPFLGNTLHDDLVLSKLGPGQAILSADSTRLPLDARHE